MAERVDGIETAVSADAQPLAGEDDHGADREMPPRQAPRLGCAWVELDARHGREPSASASTPIPSASAIFRSESVQSFHETKATLDAVYASGRLQLPFAGVLLFGY